ncbi:MAG: pyridoxal phosphate-dependent aminotransferase [Planctomycetota bacterium]
MSLSTIPYLRWAKTEQRRGEILLTLSATPAVDWADIELDPAELELCRYSAYGDAALLAGLAAEVGGAEDQVLLAASASHVHFCFAAAHLSPGDRVLYESPGYLPLVDSLSMFQVEAVRFERRFEDGFALPVERLAGVVEQMCPRLVLVTNLHNPSGVALTEAERRFLVQLCERFGVLVLCDEVYRPFLDPDPGPLSRLHPGIVSVNSFNKAYGLPQIRVGWGHGSRTAVERARRVLDATTVHNSCLSDQVAAAAWRHRDALVRRSRALAQTSWAVTEPWLRASAIDYVAPDGGVVCFPRVPAPFADADALREALLEVGVGVTPGRFFESPSHFRLGFGMPPARLNDAQSRISAVLAGRISR